MIILFCFWKALRLVRRPVAGEWDRFESYACRIKVLRCVSSSWIKDQPSEIIQDKMFEALADRFQESPVLPNLRHLSCDRDVRINKYMRLFLAPRLTHLAFIPSTRGSPDPAVVESINTACPNLRNLKIRGLTSSFSRRPHSLLASLSTLIGSLLALESLDCEFPLSPATIVHLSRLSSLKKVNLFDHPHSIARSLAGTSAPAFAHLTTLVINSWDFSSTANLLRALYLKKLKNLNIVFYCPSELVYLEALLKLYHPHALNNHQSGWPDSDDLSQVFTAIQASCDGLQSLSIAPRTGKITSLLLSPDIIAPLFSLRDLTSLRIDGPCQYDLDDAVLKEMASAWPLLQILCFCVTRQNFQRKPTLEGLAAIISGCRQLRDVHARIYVSAVQTRDINLKEYNSNGSVLILGLDTSLVDDDVNLVELAEVFATLCPKLRYLTMKPDSVSKILQNLLTTRE
jgi:hypothetical protein